MDYEVTIKQVAPEHLAGIRGTYPVSQLPEVMRTSFGKIMEALSAEGVQPSGGALAIYHGWTEDTVDVELAMTIEGVFFPQKPHREVRPSRVPGSKVAFTTHIGPYDQLENAYRAIQTYAEANRLELADMMWERYLTDPEQQPDQSKHVTEVYWPVT